jgi:hypothetical protein
MSKNTTEETYSSHNREPDELTLEAPKHPWTAEMAAIKKVHEKPPFESPTGKEMSRFDTAQGSYGKANEPRTITVAELFDEIKSDKHKAVCDFLRSPEYQSQAEELDARHKALIEKRSATQDGEERAKIDTERDQVKQALTQLKAGKHKLPAVTFSTICKGGHGLKNAVSHTGIYQVDLDLKDNPALADWTSRAKIKRTLSVDSRVLGFFDSPSNGLKVLVLVNSQSLETRDHEHAWRLANEYVCNLVRNKCGFDLAYDDSCKNPTRLCFLSHDPAAQLDELAVPLEYTEPTEQLEPPRKAHELQHAPQASGSSAGLKPMEAYNQSNDFEELLRQLGATKTKCGGWLRAGGTSPRSASWSGKSLHVFSDSFAPFEQNTSYTPADIFAVCVLGLQSASEDQGLVVRELSKLGYGDQGGQLATGEGCTIDPSFMESFKKKAGAASTAANEEAAEEVEAEQFELGADLMKLVESGIVTKEWATEAFNFITPARPPRQKPVGRLNSILRAYERRSRLPQPELYLTSAIVVGGALIADEVETEDGATTSLYAMGVGPSSSGKNASYQTPMEIINALEPEGSTIVGEMNSSVALEAAISSVGRRFLPMDEAGHTLAAARNDSYMSRVGALATKLWNGGFTPGTRANHREPYDMPRPRLSIYATGSPDRIADALEVDSIRDGGLPRYLFASARKTDRRRDMKKPDAVEDVMNDLKAAFNGYFQKGADGGSILEQVPRTFKIESSSDADALIYEFGNQAAEYAETLTQCDGAEFWFKGAENVTRIALIHAALRASTPSKALIEVQDVTFAIEVVTYSIKGWTRFIQGIGQSPRAKAIDEVMELIASQPMGVKKSALNNRFYRKWGNDKLMEYINDLLRAGKIEGRTGPRGGAIYVATGAE